MTGKSAKIALVTRSHTLASITIQQTSPLVDTSLPPPTQPMIVNGSCTNR